jgi:hypothetical protein
MLEVATEYQLPVVNLWTPYTRIEAEELFDGLHFANGANKKVLDELMTIIRSNYPELAPDDDEQGKPNLSMHLPYWGELGATNSAEEAAQLIDAWKWT